MSMAWGFRGLKIAIVGAAVALSAVPAYARHHHHARHKHHGAPASVHIAPVTIPDPDAFAAELDDIWTPSPADAVVAALVGAFRDFADRAYLLATSCPGATMDRQGPVVAIARLHPVFVQRLAAAFRDARAHGIAPCIYSAYRPPAYGVGGFRDKFESAHAYGLAVDNGNIGRPGSAEAKLWRAIALAHGIYHPYSVYSRREWNHCQLTRYTRVTHVAPLRRTITAAGPIELSAMWRTANALIDRGPARMAEAPRHVRYAHHWRRHRLART